LAPQPRKINLDEHAILGTCTTEILADGAVVSNKLAVGSITAEKLYADVFGVGVMPNPITNAIDVEVDNVTLEISGSNQVQVKLNSITPNYLNINNNLGFNNNQALEFRVENVSSDPPAGNAGRLIWRTDLNQLRVDTGSIFISVGSGGHVIEDEGVSLPQRTNLNFVGSGVTVTDDVGNDRTVVTIPTGGHVIEDEGSTLPQRAILNFVGSGVTVTDDGSDTVVTILGAGTTTKDLFTVVNPLAKTITLSHVPITDSEIVTLNGLLLRPGLSNDYTVSGNQVTFTTGVTLTVGDEILVVYSY